MHDDKYVELHDANGVAYTCRLLDLFQFAGKEYVLLSREEPFGEANAVIMECREVDGRTVFRTIEEDAEFSAVVAFVEQLGRASRSGTRPAEPQQPGAFFESLSPEFDTGGRLRWHYTLRRIPAHRLEELARELEEMGFSDLYHTENLESSEYASRYDRYDVAFWERRTHDAASFARRVAELEGLAEASWGLNYWVSRE